MNPIYVKADNTKLEEAMQRIKGLLKELDEATRWMTFKEPQLIAVPAPDHDCMSCGGLVVYGISNLDDAKKEQLQFFLKALCSEG